MGASVSDARQNDEEIWTGRKDWPLVSKEKSHFSFFRPFRKLALAFLWLCWRPFSAKGWIVDDDFFEDDLVRLWFFLGVASVVVWGLVSLLTCPLVGLAVVGSIHLAYYIVSFWVRSAFNLDRLVVREYWNNKFSK